MSCADDETELAALKAARLKIVTGTRAMSIQDGENSVTYDRVNLGDLERRIAQVQAKVDACNGVTPKRRSLTFIPSDC